MNERQKRFAENYAREGNALRAYKDAGYDVKSDNGGMASASKLLRNPKVDAYIKELSNKASNDTIADLIEIKEFWSKVVRSDEEEMRDRIKCAELMAKTQGAFTEKVELSGELNINSMAARLTGKK